MALEKFTRSVEVAADRTHSWSVLTDVARLGSWVGVLQEVTEVSRLERYRAVLQDRVGPFRLRADLAVSVTVEEPGRRVAVSATGRDRAVDSKITVSAVLELADVPGAAGAGDGTSIVVDGTYQVTGRVAAMGGGIIHKKAGRILDEFFTSVETTLN